VTEPTDVSNIVHKIEMLIERDRFDEARKEIFAALQTDPDNAELLFHLAHVEYLTERYEQAESFARRLLGQDPHDYRAQVILFLVLQATNKLAQAEQVIIGLIRDYPEETDNYVRYSRLMLKTHNFKKAQALAEEALRLDPENESALFAVLLCKFTFGKITAETDMAELLRRSPESTSTIRMLIASLSEARKYKPALELAQQLVRAYPREPAYRDMVIELRAVTHWLMWPLKPIQRFGMKGSVAIWVFCIILIKFFDRPAYESFNVYIVAGVFFYIAYSWIAPPVIRKWVV
jgi:tetratricopeptide (TPR) repeat protein